MAARARKALWPRARRALVRVTGIALLDVAAHFHVGAAAAALWQRARLTLTRALCARRARPPEVPEKAAYLAALQPRAQRAKAPG